LLAIGLAIRGELAVFFRALAGGFFRALAGAFFSGAGLDLGAGQALAGEGQVFQ
jgi:hypothetical protein